MTNFARKSNFASVRSCVHFCFCKIFVFPMTGCWLFFRSWNPEGLLQLCSKLILLSPAPIQTNIKSGDQNLLSIRSQNPEKYPWSTKHPTIEKTQISKIDKTPTTHRRKKQHCLCRLHKYSEEECPKN